jgi:NAD(P)H-dependent flavin oxidoreductase YrpB (nitropropane dioxygenase family)
MEWRTRVTELLGCRYPILEAAYNGFGNWRFAADIANTGAHGLITAHVSRTPEQLREDIRQCRNATDGSFGVNLSIGLCQRVEEMLEVALEEGVTVETSGYKPDSLAPRIKEAGVRWIHKSARVKDAIHAESLGADAVIVVGLEGAGLKSPEQLPTMVTTIWGAKQLKVPFIAAGAIGDAYGFLGALAMGAEGIMMGTAFMATEECPINKASKEALVQSRPDDPLLRYRVLASSDPEKYAEILKTRDELPVEKWLPMLERIQPSHQGLSSLADGSGLQESRASRVGSMAVVAIDRVLTLQELVDSIIQGAEKILDSWQFLKNR